MTAVILAGGKSRRLGRAKAFETVGGRTLIERVVDRLSPLTSDILVVTSPSQSDLPSPSGAEMVIDIYPDRGPLGGIYTGLTAARSTYVLVVACDMPFLNTDLLRHIVELTKEYDAVVPRTGEGRLEPLHAAYSKSCLVHIRKQLERGGLVAYSFLDVVRVRYVEEPECRILDPLLLSSFNVNRQSDLDRANAVAQQFDMAGYLPAEIAPLVGIV